jgi:hypothetical protein
VLAWIVVIGTIWLVAFSLFVLALGAATAY